MAAAQLQGVPRLTQQQADSPYRSRAGLSDREHCRQGSPSNARQPEPAFQWQGRAILQEVPKRQQHST